MNLKILSKQLVKSGAVSEQLVRHLDVCIFGTMSDLWEHDYYDAPKDKAEVIDYIIIDATNRLDVLYATLLTQIGFARSVYDRVGLIVGLEDKVKDILVWCQTSIQEAVGEEPSESMKKAAKEYFGGPSEDDGIPY